MPRFGPARDRGSASRGTTCSLPAVAPPADTQFIGICVLATCASAPTSTHAAGYNFTNIIDNSGSHVPDIGALGQRKINDSGEVAFLTSPSFFNYEIYRGNGVSATLIANSSFWGLDYGGNGAIANSGDVVFRGGTTGITVGIYRGNGGVPDSVTRRRSNSRQRRRPQALLQRDNGQQFRPHRLQSHLQIVLKFCVHRPGEWLLHPHQWVDRHSCARRCNLVHVGAYAPVINDSAQAVFTMRSAQDSTIHLVFHNGTSAASVKTDFIGGKGYSLNNAGQLAYAEIPAVKVVTNGVTTTVASTADGFDSLMKVGTGEVFINDSGQIAFWGSVSQYQGHPVDWQGVYTGPDILNDRVLVAGR